MSVSLSLFSCRSLSLSFHVCLSLSFHVCLALSLFMSVSLFLHHPLSPSLSFHLCLAHMCHHLCLSLFIWLSLHMSRSLLFHLSPLSSQCILYCLLLCVLWWWLWMWLCVCVRFFLSCTEKRSRVYVQNAPVCTFKNAPVCTFKNARNPLDTGFFEGTHGSVSKRTHGRVSNSLLVSLSLASLSHCKTGFCVFPPSHLCRPQSCPLDCSQCTLNINRLSRQRTKVMIHHKLFFLLFFL